jgi:ureidoglycolate lyase
VTYGPGTWHAPMMVLPPLEKEVEDGHTGGTGTIDFLVTQFANGVAEEDCQEVEYEGGQLGVKITAMEVSEGRAVASRL